jgi:succinylarginine dihydrolase
VIAILREINFDGIVGPTHNYGALSPGNVASMTHGGQVSNPRAAALQGIGKMKFVASLGVGQAVLPPQPRPSLRVLRELGFAGRDEDVIAQAAREAKHLLRMCSSASAMWTANAATVVPSVDAEDGRLHLVPANLTQMFHRAIEADTTRAVLAAIFADKKRFEVHAPLPGGGQFADEGAANHTRLYAADGKGVHLFAWGRLAFGSAAGGAPQKFPARQTADASEAVARLGRIDPSRVVLAQQHPDGIDGGAFHTDVLAVGNGDFLMLHELAFADRESTLRALREKVGPSFRYEVASAKDLPIADAVAGYPFNSQLVTVGNGEMAIVAPEDSRELPACRAFLERVASGDNPVKAVHYRDVRQSMHNGGGPACLRLRVAMTEDEVRAVKARVFFDAALGDELTAWITRHYREQLVADDLADPALARETMTALDELTKILRLGSVYDFQQ